MPINKLLFSVHGLLALAIPLASVEAGLVTEFCFEMANPMNASSVQLLDADDNPILNQTVGTMSFTVEYRADPTDSWSTAGSVEYLMETDGAGFLVDTGGVYCTDFPPISDPAQIQISMNVNAAEWQASGLDPWSLDNVTLSSDTGPLIVWD